MANGVINQAAYETALANVLALMMLKRAEEYARENEPEASLDLALCVWLRYPETSGLDDALENYITQYESVSDNTEAAKKKISNARIAIEDLRSTEHNTNQPALIPFDSKFSGGDRSYNGEFQINGSIPCMYCRYYHYIPEELIDEILSSITGNYVLYEGNCPACSAELLFSFYKSKTLDVYLGKSGSRKVYFRSRYLYRLLDPYFRIKWKIRNILRKQEKFHRSSGYKSYFQIKKK